MKKGLLLTLLVITMLALVVPAGARAPIVNSLPDVVISDGDPGEQATDADLGAIRLMRYLNIVALDGDLVETRNGLGHTNLNIYYGDLGAVDVVKASNTTKIIEPLTFQERATLEAGIILSSSSALNGGGFGWLSLMNTAINDAATTPATDAYSATAAGNGVAVASYPAGYDATTVMTIYAQELAWDGAATVGLLATGTFNVDSISTTALDALGDTNVLVNLGTADLNGNAAGWDNTAVAADPSGSYTPGVGFSGGGTDGLWFQALAGNSVPVYGQWQSGSGGDAGPIIAADEATIGDENIICLQATLSSNAATAAICPGWRILFASQMFNHIGGISGTTVAEDAAGIHAPTSGNDLDVQIYWSVPYELTQYADGELLQDFSGVAPGFFDVRAYLVLWNMIDWEDADFGIISLRTLTASAIPRPFGAAPAVSWGVGGTYAFDDATGRRWSGGSAPPDGFTLGVFDFSAANVEIGAGGASGYMAAGPNPLASGVYVDWTADELVRLKTTWSSISSIDTCPTFRILVLVYSPDLPATVAPFRSLLFGESFTGGLAKIQMDLNGATDQTLPCAPKGAGSHLETYVYGHNGGGTGVGSLDSRMYPTVDCYSADNSASDWPEETGRLRLSWLSVETGL